MEERAPGPRLYEHGRRPTWAEILRSARARRGAESQCAERVEQGQRRQSRGGSQSLRINWALRRGRCGFYLRCARRGRPRPIWTRISRSLGKAGFCRQAASDTLTSAALSRLPAKRKRSDGNNDGVSSAADVSKLAH